MILIGYRSLPRVGRGDGDPSKLLGTNIEQIGAHLATHRSYADTHQIFKRFIEDMHQLNLERSSTPVAFGHRTQGGWRGAGR